MKSLLLVVVIVCASCASPSASRMFTGEYYKKGTDFEYTLLLNGDSTFALSIKYQDARPACSGEWHFVDQETIELKCDPVKDVSETLTNAYMAKREMLLKVAKGDRLQLNNVLLEKRH